MGLYKNSKKLDTIAETEITFVDGVTAGTVTASKAVVVNSNKDISTFRNITLSGNLVSGSTTLSETDLAKIDGITNGTQAAGKAVVADANINTGISKVTQLHIGTSGGETQVTATGAELNYNDITTLGTAQASKTVTTDANIDVIGIRNLGVTNLDAGTSGTAGTVDIFPSTESKGKLSIACANQTGDTTVSLGAAEMGQATAITIGDPGIAASYLVQSAANMVIAEAAKVDFTVTGASTETTATAIAAIISALQTAGLMATV